MKRLLFVAMGFISLALAQVQPEAKVILEKAQAAHGGEPLKNLNTLNARYVGFTGYQQLIDQRAAIDLRTSTILLSFAEFAGQQALLSPTISQGWTAQDLTPRALEKTKINELNEVLYSPLLLLAQLDKLEAAQRLEPVQLFGQTVEVIQVKLAVYQTTLWIGADGTLVGQLLAPNRRSFYRDYRTEGGINWPQVAVVQQLSGSRWTVVGGRILLDLEINPSLGELKLEPTAAGLKLDRGWNFCFFSIELSGVEMYLSDHRELQYCGVNGVNTPGIKDGDAVISINGFNVEKLPVVVAAVLLYGAINADLELKRGDQMVKVSIGR